MSKRSWVKIKCTKFIDNMSDLELFEYVAQFLQYTLWLQSTHTPLIAAVWSVDDMWWYDISGKQLINTIETPVLSLSCWCADVVGFRCSGGQSWSDYSNAIRTCHDIELVASGRWKPEPADVLLGGCHCDKDMYFDDRGRCVAASECSCFDEASGKVVPAGRTLRRDCSIW